VPLIVKTRSSASQVANIPDVGMGLATTEPERSVGGVVRSCLADWLRRRLKVAQACARGGEWALVRAEWEPPAPRDAGATDKIQRNRRCEHSCALEWRLIIR